MLTWEQCRTILTALEYSKPFNSPEAKARHQDAIRLIGMATAHALREKARGESETQRIAREDRERIERDN